MPQLLRRVLVLLLVGTAGLIACLPGPARAVGEAGDEPEARRLPARWRDDPAEYRRLKDQWRAFQKLPRARRERLRQIDEDLNDEPPAVRARLWAVLFRYTAWLDRLDEKDRRLIESVADPEKKLEIIKGLRETEWVTRLPRTDRDQIAAAAPAERAALIDKFRKREHERRAQWQLALRAPGEPAQPRVLPGFWPLLRLYEEKSLIPTVDDKERRELRRAAATSWAEHAQVLTALADRHPIQVPPSERPGVAYFRELPDGYGEHFKGGKAGKGRDFAWHRLNNLQGRWPNFALELERTARNRKVALPDRPLGPCRPEGFVPAVQKLIEELRKDRAAATRLDEAQGKWPDYPFAVMQLARDKRLRVPGTFLPGPKEFWEKAKAPQAE